jgi:hypothetical protein
MMTLRVSTQRRIEKLMQTNRALNDKLDTAEKERAELAALVRRLSVGAPPELQQQVLCYLLTKGLLSSEEQTEQKQ